MQCLIYYPDFIHNTTSTMKWKTGRRGRRRCWIFSPSTEQWTLPLTAHPELFWHRIKISFYC